MDDKKKVDKSGQLKSVLLSKSEEGALKLIRESEVNLDLLSRLLEDQAYLARVVENVDSELLEYANWLQKYWDKVVEEDGDDYWNELQEVSSLLKHLKRSVSDISENRDDLKSALEFADLTCFISYLLRDRLEINYMKAERDVKIKKEDTNEGKIEIILDPNKAPKKEKKIEHGDMEFYIYNAKEIILVEVFPTSSEPYEDEPVFNMTQIYSAENIEGLLGNKFSFKRVEKDQTIMFGDYYLDKAEDPTHTAKIGNLYSLRKQQINLPMQATINLRNPPLNVEKLQIEVSTKTLFNLTYNWAHAEFEFVESKNKMPLGKWKAQLDSPNGEFDEYVTLVPVTSNRHLVADLIKLAYPDRFKNSTPERTVKQETSWVGRSTFYLEGYINAVSVTHHISFHPIEVLPSGVILFPESSYKNDMDRIGSFSWAKVHLAFDGTRASNSTSDPLKDLYNTVKVTLTGVLVPVLGKGYAFMPMEKNGFMPRANKLELIHFTAEVNNTDYSFNNVHSIRFNDPTFENDLLIIPVNAVQVDKEHTVEMFKEDFLAQPESFKMFARNYSVGTPVICELVGDSIVMLIGEVGSVYGKLAQNIISANKLFLDIKSPITINTVFDSFKPVIKEPVRKASFEFVK